ncbi:peroxin family protein [Kocuria palustris]|nr:peroxin family protein [Kocuria palustris]
MSKVNDRALPFADAATIVRANQKDAYFESSLRTHISDVLSLIMGNRFVNLFPEEISVAAKGLYLGLTTLLGARTLGEEYVDLLYVLRLGRRLPRFVQRLGFVLLYALFPYVALQWLKRMKLKYELAQEKDGGRTAPWAVRYFSSYKAALDALMNLHIAIFYFDGLFYQLSKRIFGLRYALGHNRDMSQLQRVGNYSLLGAIILLQFMLKGLMKLKELNDKWAKERRQRRGEIVEDDEHKDYLTVSDIEQLKSARKVVIDLNDPNQLPYIPEGSRDCLFCMTPMENPTAALCGHMFCWTCITDWLKENTECPLCRQHCLEQNLLPLR